jgi:hypothetical protein
MRRFSKFTCSITLSLSLATAPASALQSPTSRNNAVAVDRGNEGVALYEAGRWDEALARFAEAEALFHSPVFVLYTARTLRNAGRLRDARESYRRLVAEPIAPDAPAPWHQAQTDARGELTALEASIPSVIFTLTGGSPGARLSINDRLVPADAPLELDPGSYQVVATDGTRRVTVAFTLAAGAKQQRVAVAFPAPAPPARRPVSPLAPRESPGLFVPGLVVSGIGGATLIAGGITGVLALTKKPEARDNLPSSCVDGICPRSQQQAVDDATAPGRHLATATDVLLIGGAALALTGAGLLIFVTDEPTTVSAHVFPRGGSVSVTF